MVWPRQRRRGTFPVASAGAGTALGDASVAPLPGGNFPLAHKAKRAAHPFLTPEWSTRLIRAYGTDATTIFGAATSAQALGHDFGATLSEAEVRWLMTHEYARHAADVVWRRSKLGLRMKGDEVEALEGGCGGWGEVYSLGISHPTIR